MIQSLLLHEVQRVLVLRVQHCERCDIDAQPLDARAVRRLEVALPFSRPQTFVESQKFAARLCCALSSAREDCLTGKSRDALAVCN